MKPGTMKHSGSTGAKGGAMRHDAGTSMAMHSGGYRRLAIMAILSFIAMYALMYAMVDRFANVYANFNQFYMAGMMTAPMIIFELLLMGSMYASKRTNAMIIAASAIALVTFFIFIRQQAGISDKQFLQSMIPHHASALLMCEQASLHDPEIQGLCRSIKAGQQAEIDQMKAKLRELDK